MPFVAVDISKEWWITHLRRVSGIVLLVDATDDKRFNIVKDKLDTVLALPEMKSVPIAVLGNYFDDVKAVEDDLRFELGLGYNHGRPIGVYMCSTVWKVGWGPTLQWLV
ncbi:hypothetical protein RRF57_012098 [Xylaria bambusicola]|uniref:Uncharacterized protein n=1 Tax=Xylaria bambusicola TaxID=326684 RepID=A0AAN7V085_9PEZI